MKLKTNVNKKYENPISLIEDYDFSFLHEKFKRKYPVNEAVLKEIENEFRKFLILILINDLPIAATSKKVDELWHLFIIYTPQYREFCEKVFGHYIDHQPHSDLTPVPEQAISNLYLLNKKYFGGVHNFWLEDFPKEHQEELIEGIIPKPMTYKWSGWTGRIK